jgi:hypothetical protein
VVTVAGREFEVRLALVGSGGLHHVVWRAVPWDRDSWTKFKTSADGLVSVWSPAGGWVLLVDRTLANLAYRPREVPVHEWLLGVAMAVLA